MNDKCIPQHVHLASLPVQSPFAMVIIGPLRMLSIDNVIPHVVMVVFMHIPHSTSMRLLITWMDYPTSSMTLASEEVPVSR